MLYVILFEDDESRAEMRTRHMTDHLAFLEANTAAIMQAVRSHRCSLVCCHRQ